MNNHRLICIIAFLGAVLTFRAGRAELLVDDFTDSLHIDTPEEENVTITSLNVGPFDAERRVAVGTLLADPEGLLDIHELHPSQATFVLERTNPTPPPWDPPWETPGPIIFQTLLYDFENPADFTQNGVYDALLVDFHSMRGPGLPERLRMLVRQRSRYPGNSWEQSFPLTEERLEPFTAVFPFAAFYTRGGGPFGPLPTHVDELTISFLNRRDENGQWEIRLDSIRVGTLPEGDYNANGLVEQADLDLVLSNWGSLSPPAEWLGDVPNLPIGQAELDRVLTSWGTGVEPPDLTATTTTGVPEPSTWLLALLVGGIAATLPRNGRGPAAERA